MPFWLRSFRGTFLQKYFEFRLVVQEMLFNSCLLVLSSVTFVFFVFFCFDSLPAINNLSVKKGRSS